MGDSNSNIWRTKLRSTLHDDHTRELEYCKRHRVVGVGWKVSGARAGSSLSSLFRTAGAIEDPDFRWRPSDFSTVRHLAIEAKVGEFVWTRDVSGNYWVCRITGPHRYTTGSEAEHADIHHTRPAVWCKRPLNELEVPGAVIRSFIGPGQAFRKIDDAAAREITPYLFALARGRKMKPLNLDSETILRTHLAPFDVEDLIYVWMQVVLGYLAVPALQTRSTASYEWTMIHRKDQHLAIPQVKTGSTPVDLDELRKSRIHDSDRLIAFATSGRYLGARDDVRIVTTDELLEFVRGQRELLPERVGIWFDLAGANDSEV